MTDWLPTDVTPFAGIGWWAMAHVTRGGAGPPRPGPGIAGCQSQRAGDGTTAAAAAVKRA